ncbi:2-succinyl-5-enolpyruvyl-6-hydroxy-3-cyclohexene-1-carboxylic-acid synthase [Roseivirga spongicola]|uniref:2-succinyl-5-enolpyruvyl-6-hydroxy-3- cyclohexene-1-carboxylic-acid synthase n=1 Tax=Roseivirga spongicola TaxID=333140 RepID=UPI002AC9F137|nr:2-succinyl-5-enolpyruvyl-6-hydroxy-3-cyclohexene-1-carboxylic-acid synthase [Roseivirga spongicola]WPZ09087.1 2-succinyl-5-enolpyruvyl-6-hydroxy-3-cyclohexene-1-carboxylic-acid synthase [Roseivirga spongicola]
MILPHINEIASLCAAHGITQAIVSPGSRSASISLAFENHPEIDVNVIADERSAAFIGMGIAQQLRRPVALICTSGSAVYNYAPAVAEAYYQEVPLLVITADRPPEWIDQYDGQTIQQEGIFGNHIKASLSLPVDLSHSDAKWHSNRLVNQAILVSEEYPKGPVHLNVPIREPFYPSKGDKYEYPETRRITANKTERTLSEDSWKELLNEWQKAQSRLLIVGQLEPDSDLTESLTLLQSKTNLTIINEVTGNQQDIEKAIGKQDLFLQGQLKIQTPDLLITFGKSLISKNLKIFLRKNPSKHHWHIKEGNRLNDGLQHLSNNLDLSPTYFASELTKRVSAENHSDLNLDWFKMEQEASRKSEEFIKQSDFGELKAVYSVLQQIPANSQLHLANSMAVRYANFVGIRAKGVEVFCNRGTSGIDGSNSTAVGAALASGKLTTLLTGDMAFLYDRNAFWHGYDLSNLRIIVLNNAGGGIFGMIKGPKSQSSYQKLFQTEQPLTAKLTAKEFGFEYAKVKNEDRLNDELKEFFNSSASPKIIEVFSDPRKNEEIFTAYKSYCLGL